MILEIKQGLAILLIRIGSHSFSAVIISDADQATGHRYDAIIWLRPPSQHERSRVIPSIMYSPEKIELFATAEPAKVYCDCGTFSKALKTGTDSEGYGPCFDITDGEWSIGVDLPAPKFCPWCGRKLYHLLRSPLEIKGNKP